MSPWEKEVGGLFPWKDPVWEPGEGLEGENKLTLTVAPQLSEVLGIGRLHLGGGGHKGHQLWILLGLRGKLQVLKGGSQRQTAAGTHLSLETRASRTKENLLFESFATSGAVLLSTKTAYQSRSLNFVF